ncbi:MAG: ABC transporter permease [Cyanothece sp. SIO1E1]|nr:ABC transporter permease [Cyanothece sp. SIO1E1]
MSSSSKYRQSSSSLASHRRVTKRGLQVYQPASEMRHPLRLFRNMWRDLLASRELAWQLIKRDISAQYRQSFFGYAWAIIPPIVAAAGFTFASNAKVLNIGATDLPYPAYVMFSTTLWQTFTESITLPMGKMAQSKMLLAKINFPREALIIAGLGQVFFNFAIKLILIVGLFLWFSMPVTASIILAPVALVHLILLGTMFGTFLSPLSALYRDFAKGVPLLIGVWLFLTPVVYPVPSGGGIFGFLVKLNPVTPLLVTTRELSTTGVLSNQQGFWLASLLALVGMLFAWLFYRLALPYAIERISS